jgi:hypothetical protein
MFQTKFYISLSSACYGIHVCKLFVEYTIFGKLHEAPLDFM